MEDGLLFEFKRYQYTEERPNRFVVSFSDETFEAVKRLAREYEWSLSKAAHYLVRIGLEVLASEAARGRD